MYTWRDINCSLGKFSDFFLLVVTFLLCNIEHAWALAYLGREGDFFGSQTAWLGSPLLTANTSSSICLQFRVLAQENFNIRLQYRIDRTVTHTVVAELPPLGSDWRYFAMDVYLPDGVEAFHVLFQVVTRATRQSIALDDIRITEGSCIATGWSC